MKNLKFQNINPGNLEYCQISGKNDLYEVIDLGEQPLCDSLLTSEDVNLRRRTDVSEELRLFCWSISVKIALIHSHSTLLVT